MALKYLSLLRALSRVVFPPQCLVCQRPLKTGLLCYRCIIPDDSHSIDGKCHSCSSDLAPLSEEHLCSLCRTASSAIDKHRFLWNYQGAARELIIAMKYRPSKVLAGMVAKLFANQLSHVFSASHEWDMIIPIPSSPQNYKRRLFNPSRLLATNVAQILRLPLRSTILYHAEGGATQTSLRQSERKQNAQLSLQSRNYSLTDKTILLIDDVVTTGASSERAAQLLRAHGARTIDLYSLARAPSWSQNRL